MAGTTIDLPCIGDGVFIDRLYPSDAEALARSHSDPDNARYQGWKTPLSVGEAAEFIEEMTAEPVALPGSGVQLAIRDRSGGPLAGDVYIARPIDEPETVELGITLVPGFHRRGLAPRTIARASAAALGLDGVEQLVASIDDENMASRALFERAGFLLILREPGSFTRRDGSIG